MLNGATVQAELPIFTVVVPERNTLSAISEYRREARDVVCGEGELTWDDGVVSRKHSVDVCNISDSGVQVRSRVHAPVGAAAYLTGEHFRCVGSIRYCRSNDAGYLVGIELNNDPHYKNAMA